MRRTPLQPAQPMMLVTGLGLCNVHVEAVHPSSSVSEDPVLQEVPAVFASADVREDDISFRNRSKLSAKIKSFGQVEVKREYSNRASSDDLKRFLEKEGVSKDMLKRAVSISVRHLSTGDYKGIVKVFMQIPLIYFEPELQAGGSTKAIVATTQSELPKARNSSKKTSSSS